MNRIIEAALAKRYPSPECALLFEVADATAGRGSRLADAIAVSCWPSRGLWIAGFEIKSYRSDWLREKKNPEKSSVLQKFCDHWWIVAADDTIVKDGELPETWGLLVLRGNKLVTVKDAPKLEAQPLTRLFVASMLRNATNRYVPKAALEEKISEGIEQHKSQIKDENSRKAADHDRMVALFHTLKEKVDAFEQASGIDIGVYGAQTKEQALAIAFSEARRTRRSRKAARRTSRRTKRRTTRRRAR